MLIIINNYTVLFNSVFICLYNSDLELYKLCKFVVHRNVKTKLSNYSQFSNLEIKSPAVIDNVHNMVYN